MPLKRLTEGLLSPAKIRRLLSGGREKSKCGSAAGRQGERAGAAAASARCSRAAAASEASSSDCSFTMASGSSGSSTSSDARQWQDNLLFDSAPSATGPALAGRRTLAPLAAASTAAASSFGEGAVGSRGAWKGEGPGSATGSVGGEGLGSARGCAGSGGGSLGGYNAADGLGSARSSVGHLPLHINSAYGSAAASSGCDAQAAADRASQESGAAAAAAAAGADDGRQGSWDGGLALPPPPPSIPAFVSPRSAAAAAAAAATARAELACVLAPLLPPAWRSSVATASSLEEVVELVADVADQADTRALLELLATCAKAARLGQPLRAATLPAAVALLGAAVARAKPAANSAVCLPASHRVSRSHALMAHSIAEESWRWGWGAPLGAPDDVGRRAEAHLREQGCRYLRALRNYYFSDLRGWSSIPWKQSG